jgi:hypothetical protein
LFRRFGLLRRKQKRVFESAKRGSKVAMRVPSKNKDLDMHCIFFLASLIT